MADAEIEMDCRRRGLIVEVAVRYTDGDQLMSVKGWTRRGAMRAAERGLGIMRLTYAALNAKRDYEDRLAAADQ